ncbi:unnamed protein product [Protopolystoma xenopodis]|uniref:Uncharacterized protein n=1 Tax=Protopolystoma xenopodis TaxID=117903 RepID=A0A448XB89_9PLAT|nr:unnamed protein product [Protopolystoma xenopodis]
MSIAAKGATRKSGSRQSSANRHKQSAGKTGGVTGTSNLSGPVGQTVPAKGPESTDSKASVAGGLGDICPASSHPSERQDSAKLAETIDPKLVFSLHLPDCLRVPGEVELLTTRYCDQVAVGFCQRLRVDQKTVAETRRRLMAQLHLGCGNWLEPSLAELEAMSLTTVTKELKRGKQMNKKWGKRGQDVEDTMHQQQKSQGPATMEMSIGLEDKQTGPNRAFRDLLAAWEENRRREFSERSQEKEEQIELVQLLQTKLNHVRIVYTANLIRLSLAPKVKNDEILFLCAFRPPIDYHSTALYNGSTEPALQSSFPWGIREDFTQDSVALQSGQANQVNTFTMVLAPPSPQSEMCKSSEGSSKRFIDAESLREGQSAEKAEHEMSQDREGAIQEGTPPPRKKSSRRTNSSSGERTTKAKSPSAAGKSSSGAKKSR